MYELLDIDPKITNKFFEEMEKVYSKENGYELISKAFTETQKSFESQMPSDVLEALMKELIEPLKARKNNILTQDFKNHNEAIEVYENTYNELIKKLENSNDPTDQYNIELIHYIYDLLPYDQVTLVNGKKYLSSYINLNTWAKQHIIAYEQLETTHKSKPSEQNIDIATNTNKSSKDKVKFLTDQLKVFISNPHYKSDKEELQLKLLNDYDKSPEMMARSVYIYSKIQKHIPDQFETNAIGGLEPFVNSDRSINKRDIYISWYAYAIKTYMQLSKNTIPITKAYEIAQLSSYVIFPELQKMKPICSIETVRKPIRERAFYKGLRLNDFSDMRLKIKKSQEEIDLFESFFEDIIIVLQRLS